MNKQMIFIVFCFFAAAVVCQRVIDATSSDYRAKVASLVAGDELVLAGACGSARSFRANFNEY